MDENSTVMLENAEIRSLAREKLKGNWGTPLLACFIYYLITSFANTNGLLLIIGGPLAFGLAFFFLNLIRDKKYDLNDLFDGFKIFGNTFLLNLLIIIFILLWTLLFIIPGIIAAFRYALAFYIMNDNREITAMEAIEESKRLMVGYKGKLFILILSFFGWFLLCLLTCGIGFLFLAPYFNTSMAIFYEQRKLIDSKNSTDTPQALPEE